MKYAIRTVLAAAAFAAAFSCSHYHPQAPECFSSTLMCELDRQARENEQMKLEELNRIDKTELVHGDAEVDY